jgi:hypothetical protein
MDKSSRLLNKLFEDENFLVDELSIPYIVRDIINMNWWNTCDYLLGYQNNKRISLTPPTYNMKLIAIILKEFYRYKQNAVKDVDKLETELQKYINNKSNYLRQLKLFSMNYRRNDSQYFYKNGKPTWLDCTSRATYAWKYVAQNGYIDFDGVCRVLDGSWILNHCENDTVYPYKEELYKFFDEGENQVKKEIFSQNKEQLTVREWVEKLGIEIIESRKSLFDEIAHVKTDPYKNNEKRLLKENKLFGNNELHYGYVTIASRGLLKDISKASAASRASDASAASNASSASHASRASDASAASNASSVSSVSRASIASRASRASNASSASNVSRASRESESSRSNSANRASNTSRASDASRASSASNAKANNWFTVPAAIGKLDNIEHPPVFKRNKYGLAGHWKINRELVENCKLGWIDVFFGHGESALLAKRMKKNFVGIEINPDSMGGYILPYVQKAVNTYGDKNTKVELRLGDSSVFYPDLVGRFDLCYTSPPYFDFEDYGFHNQVVEECIDYDEYHKRVTIPVFTNVKKYLIDGGVLALQTEKNKNLKNKWISAITSIGFELLDNTVTGQEDIKYSQFSKRDQSLLIFKH